CTASGGWSGIQPIKGTLSTEPLTSNTSYTLTCTGAGGSASQSAEVAVAVPTMPTVTLTAAPTTVTSGNTSNLTWTSSNATACTASGGWNGEVALSGTWSTAALTNSTDYV